MDRGKVLGEALHTAMLEPEKFHDRFAVGSFEEGKTTLSIEEYEKVAQMAREVDAKVDLDMRKRSILSKAIAFATKGALICLLALVGLALQSLAIAAAAIILSIAYAFGRFDMRRQGGYAVLFGYGIHWRKGPPLFSERMGKRWHLRLGNYVITKHNRRK